MTVYLDNAATSFPKPPAVIEAVAAFLRDEGANPGRGEYGVSRRARSRVEDTRRELAALIHVPDEARLAFTLNATDALNGAISGLLAGRRGAVVTTPLEHNSVMRPLRAHCREVRVAPLDASLRLTPAALDAVIDDDVRLVVVGHVSNVTGTAQPVEALGAVCRARGVPMLVDASQSVGVLDLDASAMDLVAFSGHKNLYGPGGVGVLYVGEGVDLPPWRVGGTGGFASDLPTQPPELPWRYEAGTVNGAGIAGLGAGVRFVRERGLAKVRQHHFNLTRRLLASLVILDNVEVLNAAPDVGVVSFRLRGWAPADVARVLDETFDIAVGAGLSCAPDAHRHLSTFPDGAVRASVGLFNTEGDVDALGEALTQMADMDVYTA